MTGIHFIQWHRLFILLYQNTKFYVCKRIIHISFFTVCAYPYALRLSSFMPAALRDCIVILWTRIAKLTRSKPPELVPTLGSSPKAKGTCSSHQSIFIKLWWLVLARKGSGSLWWFRTWESGAPYKQVSIFTIILAPFCCALIASGAVQSTLTNSP